MNEYGGVYFPMHMLEYKAAIFASVRTKERLKKEISFYPKSPLVIEILFGKFVISHPQF